ncbi:MAG: pentapeptide repeat-containing protein, partial [Leptospirillia bacterium]
MICPRPDQKTLRSAHDLRHTHSLSFSVRVEGSCRKRLEVFGRRYGGGRVLKERIRRVTREEFLSWRVQGRRVWVGEALPGIDLSEVDLAGCDFSDADLSG